MQVDIGTGIFVRNTQTIRAAHRNGLVYMEVNGRVLEMRTPVAHRVGFALVKKAGEALPNEFIKLVINGYALNLPSKSAKKVGAALLRKADHADDFQRQRTNQ